MPLPEGVATEIEEARAIVGQRRVRIERTVVFDMVHVDVLHAIEAGHARGQQRENIFEIELQRVEKHLDARASSDLGREYARVNVLVLDDLLRELAQQKRRGVGHDDKIIDRVGQDEEQCHRQP